MAGARPFLSLLRAALARVRHHTSRAAAHAARTNRVLNWGLNLVLWSRLFARRRPPVPYDLGQALLQLKAVAHSAPALFVSGPPRDTAPWSEGYAAVNATLFLNLRRPNELSPLRHALPAPSFHGIYLWDSAFIAQVWKWWDPAVATDVLEAVVAARDGDRIQHFVADFTASRFTQPPLIAWSLESLCHSLEEKRWQPQLDRFYPALQGYHRWLRGHRRLPDGLYAWAHPYESGVENSPRFSSRDETRLDDTRHLAAPDLAAYMVLDCEALAALAERLGRTAEAADYHREGTELRAAVNAHLWDEEEGLYFDLDTHTGERVRRRTIASLLPLWAGIPDDDRARRLVSWVREPLAFDTLLPLPSVARNDPAYEKDMWRGPVWINTAYAVVAGLQRYGYHQDAAELAYRLCDGVYRTFEKTGRLYEFYDPERRDVDELHRKRGNRWKRWTLGSGPVTEFVGWSGLVNTLIADVLFGLRRREGGWTLRPCFPPRAQGRGFSLRLPAHGVSIDLDVLAEQAVTGTLRGATGVRRMRAEFAQPIHVEDPDVLPREASQP